MFSVCDAPTHDEWLRNIRIAAGALKYETQSGSSSSAQGSLEATGATGAPGGGATTEVEDEPSFLESVWNRVSEWFHDCVNGAIYLYETYAEATSFGELIGYATDQEALQDVDNALTEIEDIPIIGDIGYGVLEGVRAIYLVVAGKYREAAMSTVNVATSGASKGGKAGKGGKLQVGVHGGSGGSSHGGGIPFISSPKKTTGRSGNKLKPDPHATGPHTVMKRDSSGKITGYETYHPQANPQNPNPWQPVKRVDLTGKPHFDKRTGKTIPTPHVHEPGGTRPAYPSEIP